MIIIDYTFINASHPELYLVDADGSHVTSIRVVLPGYSKWEDALGTIKIKVYAGGTATDSEYDLVNNNSDVSFGNIYYLLYEDSKVDVSSPIVSGSTYNLRYYLN
ncbi:MAG: hypothetical protein IJ836_02950 [Spirochaetales bacterium]|nr:hypothetical protein [Spirochaetales bacterium]